MLNIKDLLAKASKTRLMGIVAALLALLIMDGVTVLKPSGGEEVVVDVEPAIPAADDDDSAASALGDDDDDSAAEVE